MISWIGYATFVVIIIFGLGFIIGAIHLYKEEEEYKKKYWEYRNGK